MQSTVERPKSYADERRIVSYEFSAPKEDPIYQVYVLLHLGFVIVPLVAGIDKLTSWLVNWDKYLAPRITQLLPIGGHSFMHLVGGIEIFAAVLVALKPRVGAYVVAFWLWGIMANLLLVPGFYDIALRDFGLSLGALALARLSTAYDR